MKKFNAFPGVLFYILLGQDVHGMKILTNHIGYETAGPKHAVLSAYKYFGEEYLLHLTYKDTGADHDWRWTEQWLPHAAWYLVAVSSGE